MLLPARRSSTVPTGQIGFQIEPVQISGILLKAVCYLEEGEE
jgi:hypothetical protein